MPTPKLDEALRKHYLEARPAEADIERWLQRPPRARLRWVGWTGPIAAAAVALALIFFPPTRGLEDRIAEEVWAHHLHPEPAEVVASSLVDLVKGLHRIDFSMVSSARLQDLRPTGARHCALEGQVAMRASLQDMHGGRHTLYVTRATDRLRALEAGSVEVEGGWVDVWREQGLVYALASFDAPIH